MKVGLLHPRSGVSGIWSPSLDAAAILGAAEINTAGGILGEEIDLVFADCGFSISEALGAVDTLIDLEGADVIVGGHTSNMRDDVTRRIAGRVPYIYTAQHEGAACGPSTVAIGSTDREVMAPALRWLRDTRRAERFFFVGNDYIWPRAALATTRQILGETGGHLVGHAFLPTRADLDTEVLKRIAGSTAQVVVMALVGQCAIAFNRAFAACGLDQKMLRFGLIVDETVMCGIGADASTNLFTAAHYFAGQRSRSNDGFLERYHDAFGAVAPPVSAASVSTYEGLHVVARLAGALGSRKASDLARYLDRPIARTSARTLLSGRRIVRSPTVYLGEANGTTLDVAATLQAGNG